MSSADPAAVGSLDREIARLAVPAFLALVAEPLFLLGDAAVVGRLGTPELAGLGIAGTVLTTLVGLSVFLAYGTTAGVARGVGAGRLPEALAQGVDGLWLAVGIGLPLTVATLALTDPLVEALGADAEVAGHAADYLRVAAAGITPLLLVLAATGVLRGLQDTRTPLLVAVAGNLANLVLNVALVHGTGPLPALGIAGSALGSVVAQLLMATTLVAVVARGARRHAVPLGPRRSGVRAAARAGVPLLLRTLTLRASIVVTTYAVATASAGAAVPLATHQLALTLWTFLAFALDAIAIAAQAVTGRHLGAGDVAATRAVTARMVRWGWVSGVVSGLLLAAASPWLGAVFTADGAVRDALVPVLLVAALAQPVAGVVFVLDGVLIGAGDGRYLARAGLVVLAGYAPVVLTVSALGAALPWLWTTFALGFMGGRLLTLLHRSRGDAWLVLGAAPTGRG